MSETSGLSVTRHYFCGSNTAHGYRGFTDELLSLSAEAYILKGAPGVGKSTLMRAVGSLLEKAGEEVDCFHCAGDPSSLDAVYARNRRLLIVDGTAPHQVEPCLVGARDRMIDLTVCLDEKALAAEREEIEALQSEGDANTRRAARYLRGADEIWRATAEMYERMVEANALRALTETLMALLPAQADRPCPKHLFAQAITHKGMVSFVEDALCGTVYALDAPFGFPVDRVLNILASESERRGLSFVSYMDPLNERRIAHLTFPGVTFTTAQDKDARVIPLPYDRAAAQKLSQTFAFNRAAHDLLLNQAVDALASAKKLHDSLERIYIDAMNYDRLAELRQSLFDALELK